MKFLITRNKQGCWLCLVFVAIVLSTSDAQHQPTFQQGVMPAGLMAGVQDCPTNILFSIVATCTSIQSQLPTLVERLRDAIRIQEDPNDFSPSDIAKMRETSTGLCEMADPMLACLSLLGKCPSLLGSLGGGVEDARGVLQVMCVNRSLDRYLDCTERNGGMNIRQRYCSQYRNYTMLEGTQTQAGSDSLKSTISSLASFQGFGGMLSEGAQQGVLNDRETAAMSGIAGLMGTAGPKTTINCPLFTLFSGCMASAVKKVCGRNEAESMYYVSQIQAKTGSDTCQLPPTSDDAERQYLKHMYAMQGTTNRPTQPVPGVTIPGGYQGGTRTPRVRPSRRPTTVQTQPPPIIRQPGVDNDRQQDVTSFWMPNRLRQPSSTPPRRPVSNEDFENNNNNNNQPWWYNAKDAQMTTPSSGSNKNNVIVLQLATTRAQPQPFDNAKVSSELRQNAFDWSDDDEATFGSRRGENSGRSSLSRTWHSLIFLTCFQIALSALVYLL